VLLVEVISSDKSFDMSIAEGGRISVRNNARLRQRKVYGRPRTSGSFQNYFKSSTLLPSLRKGAEKKKRRSISRELLWFALGILTIWVVFEVGDFDPILFFSSMWSK